MPFFKRFFVLFEHIRLGLCTKHLVPKKTLLSAYYKVTLHQLRWCALMNYRSSVPNCTIGINIFCK